MSARIRLIALPGGAPEEIHFVLVWAAPATERDAACAPAQLAAGDGQTTDLGLLCAPTAVTWREQRQVDLGSHRYAGPGPYTARLRWDADIAAAVVTPGARATLTRPTAAPAVALFAVSPVSGQPLQRLIKLRVDGVQNGQRLRLDGGAAQVHWLSDAGGGTQAVEFVLEYAKPGPYRITLDLLDTDGFWSATLAETPLELTYPDEIEAATGAAEAAAEQPTELATAAVTTAAVTEAVAAAGQPWLPYRYVKPVRSVYTYAAPGGGAIRRAVNPGIFLSVRAETAVAGQQWFQTAQGDWIAASAVVFFSPSELRGVELGEPAPPPPPPPDARRGVVTATALNVRARPGVAADNPPIGTLRAGDEVTIYAETSVAGARWYRIGDNRWVYGDYVRLIDAAPPPPPPPPPEVRRGVVTATTLNVRARPGVAADNPPIGTLRAGTEVSIYETRTVDGTPWHRVGADQWVSGQWVRLLDAARSAPAAAAAASQWQLPVGWVVAASLDVRAQPGAAANNPPIGQVVHNQALPILEERSVGGVKWYRVGDGQWVEGQSVGVARPKPRPTSIGAGTRWVGVSLAQQTAVAYEGDRPVFAALIASGLPGTPTVQGIFRTWLRLPTGKMSGPGYYLEDVTWTCYFYSGYALHTAYWHDAFGRPRSHGCVNLSPHDAWWVYQWSAAGGANSPTVYVYWG